MNATGLPIPAVSAPTQSPADAIPSAASLTAQAPADFVLALAQMLGANAPTTGVAAQVVAATTQESQLDADTDSGEEAAALALVPLPIVPMQIAAPPMQGGDADPLELLGLNPQPGSANARDAALLQALTERLAASSAAAESPTSNTTFMPGIDPLQPVRASADGATARTVRVPVGTPAWADEIGSRLTMMTEKGQHTASLRLSPEHLGPLEIRIAMRDDQASVWFGAAHADTRAAIEHALPRLRELFAAQGMSLTDAGVFREPPRQQMPTFANKASAGADNANESVSVAAQVKVGLLDAYA